MSLETKLKRHLASSPIFIPSLPNPEMQRSVEEQLLDSDQPIWIASHEGAPVGFIVTEYTDRGPVLARSDGGVLRLVGAFVEPDARSLRGRFGFT